MTRAAAEAAPCRRRQSCDHPRRRAYDLILANILARPLVRLAPDIAKLLGTGGRVILSGLLAHQEPQVKAAYAGQRLQLVRRRRLNGLVNPDLCASPYRPSDKISSGAQPPTLPLSLSGCFLQVSLKPDSTHHEADIRSHRRSNVGRASLPLLRATMKAMELDGVYVPHDDEYQNEYLPACYERSHGRPASPDPPERLSSFRSPRSCSSTAVTRCR